jgi:hypothetical protein
MSIFLYSHPSQMATWCGIYSLPSPKLALETTQKIVYTWDTSCVVIRHVWRAAHAHVSYPLELAIANCLSMGIWWFVTQNIFGMLGLFSAYCASSLSILSSGVSDGTPETSDALWISQIHCTLL